MDLKPFVDALAAHARALDGDRDAVVGPPAVMLRLAETHLGVRAGRLVLELEPGAPWALEHIVGRWRRGDVLPLPAVLGALRGAVVVDTDGLVARAERAASVTGPSPAVVWNLAHAARRMGEPARTATAERARRVAAQLGGASVDAVVAGVLADVHAVVRDADVAAAARVAAVVFGPGTDASAVLAPLATPAPTATATLTSTHAAPSSRGVSAVAVAAGALAVVGVFALGAFYAGTPVVDDAPVEVPAIDVVEDGPVVVPVVAPVVADGGPVVDVGVAGPAIVNVWLEGCHDCLPTFAAWATFVDGGGVPDGAVVVNVAYGSAQPTTAAFAATHRVAQGLTFDAGDRVVRPLGIGTFTTLVVDAQHRVVWRGRAVDAGFADGLRGAWGRVRP